MSIARRIIYITGPEGAGKTAFAVRVLSSKPYGFGYARIRLEPGLKEPVTRMKPKSPESVRCKAIGATGCFELACWPEPSHDDLWDSDLILDCHEDLLLEGDLSVGFATTLTVAVCRPLAPGQHLLRSVPGDSSAKRAKDILELEKGIADPDSMLEQTFKHLSPPITLSTPTVRKRLKAALTELKAVPLPKSIPRPLLSPGLHSLGTAGLVVVNLHNPDEAQGAERLLSELKALRNDGELLKQLCGPTATRIAYTAVTANLVSGTDAGLKKALARVHRVV